MNMASSGSSFAKIVNLETTTSKDNFRLLESTDILNDTDLTIPRSVPLILKTWSTSVCLSKDDLRRISVWVKLHDIPMAAYTCDGLSMISSKLGTPMLLDSYTKTLCEESRGRNCHARALIELNAENDFKDHLVAVVSLLDEPGHT
ncbi:uncharacterized protein Tco_1100017 [Tanacetum coccineum]